MTAPAFTIDKDVPPPTTGTGRAGQSKYPFAEMEVGDSFAGTSDTATVRSALRHWRTRNNSTRKFTVHKTATGYRCWRVA